MLLVRAKLPSRRPAGTQESRSWGGQVGASTCQALFFFPGRALLRTFLGMWGRGSFREGQV